VEYPFQLSFKIIALARQLSVRDARGQLVLYVKQKVFKLKEAVTVFADEAQTIPRYTMKADRILDFSARYNFMDAQGNSLGSVRRRGMRSIWKAHYEICDASDRVVMEIREENPWTKVFDGLLGEVPIVGMFTGYFFHPAYLVMQNGNQVAMRLAKQPAFFEGKFTIEKQSQLNEADETRALLALLMTVLLERGRG
jgi:uncharacterized protein YxjI